MVSIAACLPADQQLLLATRAQPPARLADLFATFVGQFSAAERARFDALARQVSADYARTDPDQAARFRSRLNRRLSDRYHTLVVWTVDRDGPPR
ncbi:MAG TPA: hypothetical protein VFU72_13585 [Nitrolancea sp.]|nr:hypothetical protein [Nitrolancea sp.]